MTRKNLSTWHIVFLYALFSFFWIYLSDRALEQVADTPSALSLLQTYKGWLFIVLTTVFLFFLLRFHRQAAECASGQLAESEQRYQGIFNSANDAFLIFSENGTIVEANAQACRIYGYPHEKLVGMRGRDIVHPDHLQTFAGFLSADAASLRQTIQSVDLRADGTPFAVEVRGAIVPHAGRRQRLAVVRDVSWGNEAKRQLAEFKSRWDQAMDFVDDAIYLVSPDDKMVRANKTFYRLTGLTPEEAIGMDITTLLHPRGETEPCPVCLARRERRDDTVVMEADHPDNPLGRPIQVMVKMVRDEKGELLNVLMGIRDLSSLAELRRQSQVIDQTYDAVIATSQEGRITVWNQGAERIFGFLRAEAIGQDIGRFIPAGVLAAAQESVFHDGGSLHSQEVELSSRTGRGFFAHLSYAALRGEAGKKVGIVYSCVDITERQKARVAMGEQLCLLKLSADVGIALTTGRNLRGILQQCCEALVKELAAAFARIWTVDETARDVLRLEASAGMYTHLDGAHGCISIDDTTKIGNIAFSRKAQLTNRVLGDPQVTEQEWARREGMVAFAGHPLLVEGRLLGVMGIFAQHPLSDMVLRSLAAVADEIALGIERKKNEEALRRSTAEFEAIFHAMPDGVVFVDREGRIAMVNPAFLSIFGYEFNELDGMSAALLYAEQADYEEQALPGGAETGGGQLKPSELRYRRKNGVEFWGETISAQVRDDQGKVFGILGITRDITERKIAETEKLRFQEQIRQTQKMEAMGTLAGGIAHDFNNILSAILGYTELAQYKLPKGSEIGSDLENVAKAGMRAKELVKQILAFSRQTEHEPRPLEIRLIVKEALKLLRASIPANIEIRQEIGERCGTVFADPTQIHQVVMNLCTNAYHAMRATGGILRVSLAQTTLGREHPLVQDLTLAPGAYVELVVADTGCGMTPAVAQRVFEPYFTTKEKGDGTGLGLSVVHGIAKNCGGNITVESEPGKGSTFTVYFPLAEGRSVAEESIVATPLPRGSGRVLVVDDEEPLALMLARMLEGLGYTVATATNSGDAVRRFAEAPQAFDLVITDMAMPNMTGAELARQVLAIRPGMPIVLCTGFSEVINEEKAKAIGIREFLMKPLLLGDVAKAVSRALAGPR
ncbi:hybrid sensor histidine kinase/response regulator [Thiovibrio sp. JS02]